MHIIVVPEASPATARTCLSLQPSTLQPFLRASRPSSRRAASFSIFLVLIPLRCPVPTPRQRRFRNGFVTTAERLFHVLCAVVCAGPIASPGSGPSALCLPSANSGGLDQGLSLILETQSEEQELLGQGVSAKQ
jgi:hypothetical protein